MYRVTPDLAAQRWGAQVAAVVPRDGLVNVHTYATLVIDGCAVRVDVTFPVDGWDGSSDMVLACGDGVDHPAGTDPLGSKAALVEQHCDPAVREPFIAALSAAR